jgi:peptidoglycan/xylan/chitin deacetylase (PgdA/CDA1 family)
VTLLAGVLAALVALLSGGGARHAAPASHASSHGAGESRSVGRSSLRTVPPGPGYPETSEVRRLIAMGRPIYCAPNRGNEVALTFDDGPGPYTRLMVHKLRKHGVQATFFIVGRNVAAMAAWPRQELALGAVGDHTFTHALMTSLSAAQQTSEMLSTQGAIARAGGGRVFLFRPPYGAHAASTDGIARSSGMLQVLWNVDSRDSLGASYRQIEQRVIAGLRPGSIVLMHENHGQTIRAMLSIFAALERRHLRAVSVPQLLTDDPPPSAVVAAGGRACGVTAGASSAGH